MPATSPNNMVFKIIHTKLEIQANIFSLLKKKTLQIEFRTVRVYRIISLFLLE